MDVERIWSAFTGGMKGFAPSPSAGNLLQGKTVGIIGAGRIGSAYARMMVEGHKVITPYLPCFCLPAHFTFT